MPDTPAETTIVKAHTQTEHLTLVYAYPAHEPRTSDSHYHTFNETRKRMKKLGLLKCWICGTTANVELHHDKVEFALANDIDWRLFALDHPEWHLLSDDDLKEKIEMEGNMTPLCSEHHRGLTGIHTIHASAFNAQKYLREGATMPERAIRSGAPPV